MWSGDVLLHLTSQCPKNLELQSFVLHWLIAILLNFQLMSGSFIVWVLIYFCSVLIYSHQVRVGARDLKSLREIRSSRLVPILEVSELHKGASGARKRWCPVKHDQVKRKLPSVTTKMTVVTKTVALLDSSCTSWSFTSGRSRIVQTLGGSCTNSKGGALTYYFLPFSPKTA